MKRFSSGAALATLVLGLVSAPAIAHGGDRGHHGNGGRHGHYHGGGHRHHHDRHYVERYAGRVYVQPAPPVPAVTLTASTATAAYVNPRTYAAPTYNAPRGYSQTVYTPAPPVDPGLAAAANTGLECQGWATNQSGHDPSNISPWTTPIMISTYNRMLASCMQSRGYRAN